MSEQVSGGCQCGRVRYRVTIHNEEAYLCHCRMCQRATGGVSIAFKNVKQADVEWIGERPDEYVSSPIARRGFCSLCGTPLTFRFPDSENMDLTVGSFDAPGRFRPTSHSGIESWHEAWLDTRALPGERTEQNPSTRDRWMKAVGKMPD
jgi:hypothetical protein